MLETTITPYMCVSAVYTCLPPHTKYRHTYPPQSTHTLTHTHIHTHSLSHTHSDIHTHTHSHTHTHRYPTILLCFHLNRGTGGDGMYRGGDGIIREMMFRKSLTLSVLTERRVYSPFGLEGTRGSVVQRSSRRALAVCSFAIVFF